MDWKKISKVGAAIGFIIAAFGTGVGSGFYFDQPQEIVKEISVEVPVEVPVEKVVYQDKLVYVDNENLDLVLDHLYDNDGQVEYLLEDLDDDELNLVVERIAFVNEIKSLAAAEVKAEAADELDKEIYTFADNSTIKFDEDDIERLRVQDDDDELIIDDVDFEDSDATVLVTAKFEQDDVKFEADFEVEFKDGSVDDVSLLEIRER